MAKLNLTSFGRPKKLSHYLRLKITLNILVVSYTKEFAILQFAILVMLVKQ